VVFSSLIFLFGFLPLFLIAYYLIPVRLRSWLILLTSYAFYG
jgi:alginate O-acetyltransferase complex protein AlgI